MKIFFQNIETEEKTVDGEVLGELDQVSIFFLKPSAFSIQDSDQNSLRNIRRIYFLSHFIVKDLNFFNLKISNGSFLREFWSELRSEFLAQFWLQF